MLCYLLVSSARSALFLFKLEACLALLCRAVRFGRCLACARLATQEKKLSPFIGVCVRVSVCVGTQKKKGALPGTDGGGSILCCACLGEVTSGAPIIPSLPPPMLSTIFPSRLLRLVYIRRPSATKTKKKHGEKYDQKSSFSRSHAHPDRHPRFSRSTS